MTPIAILRHRQADGRMTVRFCPELTLIVACCRWPHSHERDSAIRAAAAGVADWDLFERLVTRHRVTPLVRNGLKCAEVELPAAVEERLGKRAAELAERGLAMARESVRLQQAFRAAGLPALVVKGAPLAILAYGEFGLKESWDIDLLTCPEALPKARSIIRELGYERVFPTRLTPAQFDRFDEYAIEEEYLNPKRRMTVELHWRVVLNKLLMPAVDARSPSQSVRAAGAELLTFGDEILFAFLCVHGAQHSWNRLKWLADLGALIASRNPNEIERLYRSAVELGAGRTPAVGLLLCRRLFAVPLAPRLLAELTRDRFTAFIETVALRAINDRREASTGVLSRFREMCSHLLLAPGAAFMRAQARVLWNMPLERARFGAAPFGLTFHLLRIPLWIARLAKHSSDRTAGSYSQAAGD